MSKAQSVSFLLSQVRASGVALAGGEVEFFAAGTSTPKTIWLDRDKANPAVNPYALDANGTAQLFADGIYRVVVRDSTGAEKYDRDGLSFRDASSNVYDVADYASLAAAVASIGSTPATLQFASDVTVSANLVIPPTLELMPLNGAKINLVAYTLSYAGSTARWPVAQIFDLSGGGTVAISGRSLYSEQFGAVGGSTDDTVAIKALFASGTGNRINISNQYKVTDTIAVLSGTTVVAAPGAGITFEPTTPKSSGFDFSGVTNIYFGAINLSCNQNVVNCESVRNTSSNIVLDHHSITTASLTGQNGASIAIDHSSKVTINTPIINITSASSPSTYGIQGIAARASDHIYIVKPNVTGTKGIYGDGIYIESCSYVDIDSPQIYDFTRIGIVIESAGGVLSKFININNPQIEYGHDNQLTEYNAGVWVEGGASDSTVIISGGLIKNCGNFGALVNNGASIYGTDISLCGIGVNTYGDASITSTKLHNNTAFGASFTQLPSGSYVNFKSNNVYNNGQHGLDVEQSHGNIIVSDNTFKDNGGSINTTYPNYGSGIKINRTYLDQKFIIKNNVFISSMNQVATTGQAYSIVGVAGGDFNYNTAYIENNQFLFNGTFSSVWPASMSTVPTSFGYDSTSTITPYELIDRNINSKVVSVGYWNLAGNSAAGSPRFLGYISAAPVSGTFRRGDYFVNTNIVAGGAYVFICTADGTPGTWKAVNITP